MTIEAVVFDIGGVLEVTPSLGVAEMWESRLGLDPGEIDKRMQDVWEGGATELIEYVRRLRPRYRTGIVSNSFVGARAREQAAYGFVDLVDEIIYSHECGMSKPDPAIYALACERLRVEPAQMVFVDDYEPCVAGAREAGIHAVLYRDNAQAIRDIEALLGQ
jgi:putative hydrolase of the HAD superfamily